MCVCVRERRKNVGGKWNRETSSITHTQTEGEKSQIRLWNFCDGKNKVNRSKKSSCHMNESEGMERGREGGSHVFFEAILDFVKKTKS